MTTTRRAARPAAAAANAMPIRLGEALAGGVSDADVAKLLRFVLLSIALHALVILLFGTATGGGGGRGSGTAAGPLEVTLRALGVGTGSGLREAPGVDARPERAALPRRPAGGRRRSRVPPACRTPRPRDPCRQRPRRRLRQKPPRRR